MSELGRFLACRPGWIDEEGCHDREGNRTHCRRHQQGRLDPILLRGDGDDECSQPDTQGLSGLPDAHGETAPIGREPADNDPPARRVRARPSHAAEKQEEGQRCIRGRERRTQCTGGDDSQPRGHGSALADAVDDGAPGDQREHHADEWCGGDRSGVDERQASVEMQRWYEERRGTDEDGAGDLADHADGQHEPSVWRSLPGQLPFGHVSTS